MYLLKIYKGIPELTTIKSYIQMNLLIVNQFKYQYMGTIDVYIPIVPVLLFTTPYERSF